MRHKIFILPAIAFLLMFSVLPVLADGDDLVRNENMAEVGNAFELHSNTGMNYADGSYGGDGGDGGDIRNGRMMRDYPGPVAVVNNEVCCPEEEEGDIDEVTTGNGGAGGDAMDGGTVLTGNASTRLDIDNTVNRNDSRTSRGEDADGETRVINQNQAAVMSGGGLAANSGFNEADGSMGGSGGDGGDVVNTESGDIDESMTGDGASGGSGSLGGLVQTGAAESRAGVVERINENITRINR